MNLANSVVFLLYLAVVAFFIGYSAALAVDWLRRWRQRPHRRKGSQL